MINMELKLKDVSGNLPTSTFELFDDEVKVGKIQIRHKPSRAENLPESLASHVYYEINSEFRNRNFGNKILKMGLEKAREIGLKEILLTVNEESIASKKIIENNGGVFVLSEFIEGENRNVLKYKINLC